MVTRLFDVHGGAAQWNQPPLRNVRQRKRGYARAHIGPGRVRPHVVQTESPVAENTLVATRQQQLRGNRLARFPALLQRKQAALPEEFLSESKTLGAEARLGGACCV